MKIHIRKTNAQETIQIAKKRNLSSFKKKHFIVKLTKTGNMFQKKSGGSGLRTRTNDIQASSIVDNHYNKNSGMTSIYCRKKLLQFEKKTQKLQTSGEKSEKTSACIIKTLYVSTGPKEHLNRFFLKTTYNIIVLFQTLREKFSTG